MNLNIRIRKNIVNRWEMILEYNEKSIYELEKSEILIQTSEFSKKAVTIVDKKKYKGIVFYDFKEKAFVDDINQESNTQAIVGLLSDEFFDVEMFVIDMVSIANMNTELVEKFKISYAMYYAEIGNLPFDERYTAISKFVNNYIYKRR